MTKDFYTVRENCIQIHQEVTELLLVGKTIGEDLGLISDNELSTHEKTKSWDGMGRYAKELYDDKAMWDKLPEKSAIYLEYSGIRKVWEKQKAREELFDCYQQLGGKSLHIINHEKY